MKLKDWIVAIAIVLGLAVATGAQVGTFTAIAVSDTQRHTVPAVTSDIFTLNAAMQTLTTKTINLASNTLSGTTAQFNTALSDNDFATLAGAEVLTNKTVDAEGTGNLLTIPVKQWFPAAFCQNVTPATVWSLAPLLPALVSCDTGTNTQKGTLDFADGVDVSEAQMSMMLPSDWVGAVDVRFKWFTTATTGSVVWQVASICVADAETSDPAFNAAGTVIDTAKGTTLQDNDAFIAGLTTTGCAAGELLYLRVFRDPTNGSDDLAATASLRGIELTYRRGL